MTPRVSIVIAAFNAEPYIAKAIASAQAQTVQDTEIIVVDDGSGDGTARVAEEMAAGDARVIVIRQAGNRGVSAARNAALAVARGVWMAVLDADDEYVPERLERILNYAELHGVDMVADNLAMHDFETGAPLGRAFPDDWMQGGQDVDLSYLLERDIPGLYHHEIGFFKPVIKLALLTENDIRYDETIYSAEDFLLYSECLIAGGRMRFMPGSYYLYARRKGSLSSLKKSSESNKRVCEVLFRRLPDNRMRDVALLRLRLDAINYELFKWHFENGRIFEALRAAATMRFDFAVRAILYTILRRLGWSARNPRARNIEVIRRRAGPLRRGYYGI